MRTQKKIKSLKMSYAKQQSIYRTCRNYYKQNDAVQKKIRLLVREAAKDEPEDCLALFAVLTTERSIRSIALDHFMSERKLYDLRKKFYESW